MINNTLLTAIFVTLCLIILVILSNYYYMKTFFKKELDKAEFTISDLIRKLADENEEIDCLRKKNKEKPMANFVWNYNKLEDYLHRFGVSYEAYYGKSKFMKDINEYCYIIDVFNKQKIQLFEIILPDITKTNPEGFLTIYDISQRKIVGKDVDFKNICKIINKKIIF